MPPFEPKRTLARVTRTGAKARWLPRVHALLGAPLGFYLGFHLWWLWPAHVDREQWVMRASASGWGHGLGVLVGGMFVLHAVLGLLRQGHGAPASSSLAARGERSMRRLQAATGVLALAFVLYHVATVWALDRGAHYSPRQPYDALWHTLGKPWPLVIYAVGLAAVCFHFAHGAPRALATFGCAPSTRAFRGLRYGFGALGLALWLGYLQLLAHFATGHGLWPEAVG